MRVRGGPAGRGVSDAALRISAMFGIAVDGREEAEHAERLAGASRTARELDAELARGGIALVTGPSGSGKTLILRALAGRLRGRAVVAGRETRERRGAEDRAARGSGERVIDVLVRGRERDGVLPAISALSCAGLADANLFLRRAGSLSEGQRARLELAVAIRRMGARAGVRTLIIDEFGSTLDRPCAARLARSVRRWASGSGARVVCATAHDDLLEALAPDLLVVQSDDGDARIAAKPRGRAA